MQVTIEQIIQMFVEALEKNGATKEELDGYLNLMRKYIIKEEN